MNPTKTSWADEIEDDFPPVPKPKGQAWADVEDDEAQISSKQDGTISRFLGEEDKNGNRAAVRYVVRDGKTYKEISLVKMRMVEKYVNTAALARMSMAKFGKAADASDYASAVAKEDVVTEIELNPTLKHKNVGDDEKFWEESIAISEAIMGTADKKKWDANAVREQREDTEKAAALDAAPPPAAAQMTRDENQKKAYVPPSLRNRTMTTMDQDKEESTLRITNLCEDVRDGDLEILLAPFGRRIKTFLARHKEGEKAGQSKGFAFVTFAERKDAEAALKKLHGHGYDNLILQVYWAQKRD